MEPTKSVKTEDLIDDLKDSKRAMLRLFPPAEFGEDENCELLYNTLDAALSYVKPQSKLARIELTQAEINALYDTANQMKDNLEYYDFMGPKRSEKFREAYDSGMQKLLRAMMINKK